MKKIYDKNIWTNFNKNILFHLCCDIAVSISGDKKERLARAAEPRRKVSSHLVVEQREVRFLTRLNAFSVTPRT